MMTNQEVLKRVVKYVTKTLSERWNNLETAEASIEEILEEYKGEIEDNNVYSAICEIENLID